jgi:peptidoglycan lytic transglycosylase
LKSRLRFGIVNISIGIGLALCLLTLPACTATAETEEHTESVLDTQNGDATFYGRRFQGDTTASGSKFDNRKALAAHLTYPFGTVARVTNLRNGRAVNVVIVDRGPYGRNRRQGAIIDLSRTAAEQLGFVRDGQVRVKLEVLAWGNGARQ